jgi:hypothetical protein
LILIALLFCNQVFAFDQDSYQVIRVTDVNNELVTGAKVEIPGTKYTYYTNIKGECYIPAQVLRQYNYISIQCISYKVLNVQVKDLSSKVILEFR